MHSHTAETGSKTKPRYQLSLRSRIAWLIAIMLLPVVSVITIFSLTDDNIVPHENSALAQQFTTNTEQESATEQIDFPTGYGQDEGPTTLILYDDQAQDWETAELYAIATANLATHFGKVDIQKTDDYNSGEMADFDAAIFVGADWKSELPQELLDDVRAEIVPVMWLGENAEQLTGGASPNSGSFVDQYGWDPDSPVGIETADMARLDYKDQNLNRITESEGSLYLPNIVAEDNVEVLATGICGEDPAEPNNCSIIDDESPYGTTKNVTTLPWAVQSKNLIYVSEIPLDYIDDNDAYLVFSDLYYRLLAPDTKPLRQAAVRIEDVNPESDPKDLRAVADLLYERNVPFQVAVIPVMVDQARGREAWYGLSIQDEPEIIEALEYMQDRGGTLVQHGTTHQYGTLDNPYSGRSGEDYEFFGYDCSSTEFPPYVWEECQQDSWVRKSQPVPNDKVSDHKERLKFGYDIMVDAGLGAPDVFVTPHYTASPNAYAAIAETYDARYEQVEYYAGMLSGGEHDPERSFAQVFPYSVHDIYGSTVFPENLHNVTETEQNNHTIRTPQTLIDRAENNLMITESTASFYFHPFLDLADLEELVDGVKELGYTFTPVSELK